MSALGSLISMVLSSGGVIVFAFSVFMIPLVKQFGWKRSEVSVAFSLSVVVSAISYPTIGWLMDRFGVKIVTLISIFGLAVCFALLSLTKSLAMFYLVFLIIGLFGPGHSPMPYAKIVSGWFDKARGLALGIVMAGSGISFAILPLYLGYLIHAYGWRDAYIGLSLAILIVPGMAVSLLVRNPPGGRMGATTDEITLPGLSLVEATRTYAFWAVGVAVFGVTVAFNGINAHLMPLLTDRGIAASSASGLLFCLGIGSIAGRIATGVLFDRFHATIITAGVFAVGTVGVCLLAGSGGASLLAAVLCLGISIGGETDAIGYLTSRYFGLKDYGAIYGCYFSIFAIGSALGPLIMAKAFDTTHSYNAALWSFVPGTLIAIGLILSLGPYRYAKR